MIDRLSVRNIRCHPSVDLTFGIDFGPPETRRVTIVTGPNGVGKTTLLDAIDSLAGIQDVLEAAPRRAHAGEVRRGLQLAAWPPGSVIHAWSGDVEFGLLQDRAIPAPCAILRLDRSSLCSRRETTVQHIANFLEDEEDVGAVLDAFRALMPHVSDIALTGRSLTFDTHRLTKEPLSHLDDGSLYVLALLEMVTRKPNGTVLVDDIPCLSIGVQKRLLGAVGEVAATHGTQMIVATQAPAIIGSLLTCQTHLFEHGPLGSTLVQ